MIQTLLKIPSQLLVLLVRGYQLFISPLFPPSCRYTPTCSQYAILAFKKYGAIKGLILTSHRLLRCNPWGGHGHDPPRWYGEKVETQAEETQAEETQTEQQQPEPQPES